MEPKRIAELHTFYASYWWTVTTFRYFEQQQFAVCPLWIEMNGLIERTRLAITYSELNFMMILFTLPHCPIFLWRTLQFAAILVVEFKPKLIPHYPFLLAFILRFIVHITSEVFSNPLDESTTVVTLYNTWHVLNNFKRLFSRLLGIPSVIPLSKTRLKSLVF